jgi:hypothetical protein
MTDIPIPHDIDEVTPGWLTDRLRSAGAISSGAVSAVEPVPIGVGVGILGRLFRLNLVYEPGGQGPASVVVKLPSLVADTRALVGMFGFYEKEVRFYQQAAGRSPLGTPECYHADFSPETGDFVLLLEDLAGRRLLDQIAGATPEEAETAILAIADHHAAWWEHPDLATFAWAPTPDQPPTPQAVAIGIQQSWPIVDQEFGHLLSPSMRDLALRMPGVTGAILGKLSNDPLTLLHGDYRLDNIFFGADDGQAHVTAVDWQIVYRGRGIYDVGYFLSQSVASDVRREIEEPLVRRYHDRLAELGVNGYSFDACWEDYRLACLWCLVYPLNAGGLDLGNERGHLLGETLLGRAVAAIEDLEAADLMPEAVPQVQPAGG